MFDNIWLVLPDTNQLVSPYRLYERSKRIVAAQPFSVTMTNVVLAEDLDGFLRGKNDILVMSRSALGTQPLVERVHCFEKEVEKGKPVRNLLSDSVFVCDDFSGKERLWIEVDVLEIDTDTGERKGAVQAFESLAATAGAVFPAVVPYIFSASAVANLVNRLVNVLEKDQHVVKVPIALHPDEPRPAHAPLQEGCFVAFANPVNPERFTLEADGLLYEKGRPAPASVSYCVFNVSPDRHIAPEFVLNQKIATLLTQIDRGNNNAAVCTMTFLEDTLIQYSNYKKLQRYLQLSKRSARSPEEEALLKRLGSEEALQAFLPQISRAAQSS